MPIRQEGITMGRYNFEQHTRDGYVVTPALAKQWLEKNTNNRNVNFAKVKKMAKDSPATSVAGLFLFP